ncbi:MAG: hypothetical protein HKN29_11575 [Rhodothermales bacterium]|nr:hypothetical protein [Rhodothermales bacterium]
MLAAVAVPLAYFLRFGYGFGYSDQDEFLPWLRARLEPGLLSEDWFVASQQSGFNVRTGFVWLLEAPSHLLGIENAVLLLYAGAMLALVLAVYHLARVLGAGEMGAIVASLAAVALLPRWTLGGNAAASSMLVPSLVAWSMGLWAVVNALRKQPGRAGLLVGLAAWIQILVAAQVGAIVLFALLVAGPTTRKQAARFALPALGLALPVAVLLALSGTGLPSDSFAILARIRAPHHYLPSAFPASDYLQLAALTAAGLWALSRTRLKRSASLNRLVGALLAGVLVAVTVGLIAWKTDSAFFLSLQPFKATVLGQILLVCTTCALLPSTRLPGWTWTGALVAVVAAWAMIAAGFTVGGRPDIRQAPAAAAAAWVAERTLPRDRVAIPPSVTGFRYSSGRAIVINFKAYPFTADGTGEWLQRLTDWAPGALDGAGNSNWRATASTLLPALDAGYESLTPDSLAALCVRYEVQIVVRRTPLAPHPGFQMAARDGEFLIYTRNTA